MYAEKFLHTPKPDFLEEFKSLHEPMSLEMRQIEAIALSVREKLGYSLKPINNLVRTLEKSGVAILRYSSLWKVRIDGLSQHSGMDRPLCAIFTSGETSAVRETFSLAHELGHIVLHSKINQRRFDELADGKLLEDQANRFAAAFLLPSTAFLADLITPAISYFEHLKKKWRVSIATMIRRCYDLGKISKEEYSSLNVRLSQKRWRKKEPLDDIFEAEKPVLIKQIFTTLVQRHGVKGCQIAEEMCLNPRDLSSISDLPANFFSDDDGQTNIIGFEVAAARA
jgi:Zn-dependent peptidase ImmA (M78 family)